MYISHSLLAANLNGNSYTEASKSGEAAADIVRGTECNGGNIRRLDIASLAWAMHDISTSMGNESKISNILKKLLSLGGRI